MEGKDVETGIAICLSHCVSGERHYYWQMLYEQGPWVNSGYFLSSIGALPLWELQASGLASLHFGKLGPQWCSP